jgi:hypothetical protein
VLPLENTDEDEDENAEDLRDAGKKVKNQLTKDHNIMSSNLYLDSAMSDLMQCECNVSKCLEDYHGNDNG